MVIFRVCLLNGGVTQVVCAGGLNMHVKIQHVRHFAVAHMHGANRCCECRADNPELIIGIDESRSRAAVGQRQSFAGNKYLP